MSIANKRQSRASEARPNERDISRASVLTNRTTPRSWKKTDTASKDTEKMGGELPHVKNSGTVKCHQTNQKQVANSTSRRAFSDKYAKCTNLDRIIKIQTELKSPITTNPTLRSKRAICLRDEKDFLINFDKKYSIQNYQPLKPSDNYYVNRPVYKYPYNMLSAKLKVVKKSTPVNQIDQASCKDYTSPNASQISAWLMQCNNASVTLGDTKETGTEPKLAVDNVQTNLDSKKHLTSYTSSHSTVHKSKDIVPELNKKHTFGKQETRSTSHSKSPNLKCPTKQLVHSNLKILEEQSKLNDLRQNQSNATYENQKSTKSSDEILDYNESDISKSGNNIKYYDVNSTNATDWASVSSSEWGDDMCEFDRQQSFRVHEMFEEIDRILFDNPNFDSQDLTPLRYNAAVNTTTSTVDKAYNHEVNAKSSDMSIFSYINDLNEENLKLLCLNPVVNLNSPLQYAQHLDNPSGIQDHLFYECKDWLSRFPHLRVVGKQIVASEGFKSTTCTGQPGNSNIVSDCSKCTDLSCITDKSTDTGGQTLSETGSSDTQNRMTNSESAVTVNANCMDEEIFAMDGNYEELLIDSQQKNLVERRNKTPSDEQKRQQHQHQHHQHHEHREHQDKSSVSDRRKSISKEQVDNKHHQHHHDHRISVVKKHLPNSVEMILSVISQHLWKDLMDWLRISLVENMSAVSNKGDVNAIYQKNIPHHTFPLHRLRDSILSRCSSSVGDTQNSLSLPSFRLSKQTKPVNTDMSTLGSGQTTVQTNEFNAELSDLLQISTKTLQMREKSIIHEVSDNANRLQPTAASHVATDSLCNHPSTTTTTATSLHSSSVFMTTVTTSVSRVSPQPAGGSFVTRPVSSLHCKSPHYLTRKCVPTASSGCITEIPSHSGSSGVGVVGVAANLHHNGRLAPLDKIRTPLPPPPPIQYSSRLEENTIFSSTTPITPTIQLANTESSTHSTGTSALSRCHNFNGNQFLSSIIVGPTPSPPSPLASTTTTTNAIGQNIQTSTIPANILGDGAASRSVILPPLSNCTVNSSSTTINTIPVSNTSSNPLTNTGLSLPSPKNNLSLAPKTGFALHQHAGQVNQHPPYLHKGISGNLVAQQNTNNSSVNTSVYTQRISSKSSTHRKQSSTKQITFPLPPIDTSKERLGNHQKLWRPYSSRPSIITKSIANSSSILTRACSTLLIQTPEMCSDACSVKINPAIFIGSTTNCLRSNDSVSH
ncbi:unnamed protein product [Trichobilharzia szidati]|nr:unnamed protein product [Trichobilharzia szidati]